jgi:hypothetical protein
LLPDVSLPVFLPADDDRYDRFDRIPGSQPRHVFNPAWERIEREENKRKRGKYDKKLSGLGFMLFACCLCFHYEADW